MHAICDKPTRHGRAAEFEAATPYMYSSYDGNDECETITARKVLITALLL